MGYYTHFRHRFFPNFLRLFILHPTIMAKTLSSQTDYVRNIRDQIKADAASFAATAEPKRRESHINGRIKELQENFNEAKSAHLKIIAAREESGLKEKYFAEEVFIKLKELYFEYYGELNEALNEETKGNANTTLGQEKSIDFKLRRIELPPFSGGYERWRPFYELYVSLVHSNQSLTDVQKLHYLKSSVQGEAARLLQHISLEEKNYEAAWQILTERYENKRVLVNTHLRILMNQKHIMNESASTIKNILDTTTECLHSLRNLSVPVDTWDTMLIYILCSKLPTATQEAWEQHLQGAKNLTEFTTFSKFLETRFRTLESIEQSKVDSRKVGQSTFAHTNLPKNTKSFHTQYDSKNQQKPQVSDACHLCKGTHKLYQCEQFIKMNINNRYETAKKLSVCTNCLTQGHFKTQCKSTFRCRHCKGNHHTLLHYDVTASSQGNQQRNPYTNNYKTTVQHLVCNQNDQQNVGNIPLHNQNEHQSQQQNTFQPQHNTQLNSQLTGLNIPGSCQQLNNLPEVQSLFTQPKNLTKVLLATALVNCQTHSGDFLTLRALIDPGSEATFITESAVQKLRLQKKKSIASIVSLGQAKTGVSRNQVSITMFATNNSKFNLTINALVYSNITSILPAETLDTKDWQHLQNLRLADPFFNIPGKIDLLLGADAYAVIILPGLKKGPTGSPVAQNSELGWIISGNVAHSNKNKTIQTHHHLINLDAQIRKFWEIEEINEKRKFTEEEQDCENHYVQTHQRHQDGRYQVRLPFKGKNRPVFENTRQVAISRLIQLENRFNTNPKLKGMYTECINDYLHLSHMTETETSNNGQDYHLPHHAVFKDSSTTKLRVVFDASCKTLNGKSLNDCLMIGPTLQNNLSNIIINWRKFKYAYTADITKMYRQIWMDPQDATYQKICWRNNNDSTIKTYTLNTVTFGTASAPFLAVRTLLQLASDEQHNFPLAAEILRNNFYVDDVLHGTDTIDEAIEAQKQLTGITNSAGFPLRKWASNNEIILQNIPEEDREIKTPLSFGQENFVKTLGFQWYPGPDIFKFKIALPTISKISKRTILSDVSRLFDPHGCIYVLYWPNLLCKNSGCSN